MIVSYNSARIIQRTLEALFDAQRQASGPTEILVWDNGSEDETASLVSSFVDKVTLFRSDENLGFGKGNNTLARRAKGDILVLLNDDMVVETGFLKALEPYYEIPDLFAVTGFLYEGNPNRVYESYVTLSFRKGRLRFSRKNRNVEGCPRDEAGRLLSAQATGGGSAFHRGRLDELGGFDSLYFPCYWEDTDLSYRAWRRGWKVFYEPSARVNHVRSDDQRTASGTWKIRKSRISRRNRYRFLWRNLLDQSWFAAHLAGLPIHLLSELGKGHWWTFGALLQATGALREIRRKRREEREALVRTDREIVYLLSEVKPRKE